MCGIAGIILPETADGMSAVGAAMLRELEHRGPDDHGWLCHRRGEVRRGQGAPDDLPLEVMLLHRRLSIIDLSAAGRQPMSSVDGRYHLVFNGEIYNYIELRQRLRSEGIAFHTQSDTEVLLAALMHWGVDALPRLVGMFAFALLDTRARTVLLARDFLGIKPLLYVQTPRHFVFASELKALLEAPDVPRQIDAESLWRYLSFGVTDSGSKSLLSGVMRIPPGHYAVYDMERHCLAEPRRYWSVDLSVSADVSFDEAARRLRELFLESIRLHLRSDVPIGTALSGGIDSSAIAMAVRLVGGTQTDFHTFSFVTGEPGLDEEAWMDMAAAATGATVHKVRIDPAELAADMDAMVRTQDEPFSSTSIYAQYRVFRLARESGVKVLLDGQGADELLAGYRGFLTARLARLLHGGRFGETAALLRGVRGQPGVQAWKLLGHACLHLLPERLGRAFRGMIQGHGAASTVNWSWFERRGVMPVMNNFPTGRFLRDLMHESLTDTSLPMLLRYEDRNSMAFGVESRVPFLTPDLVAFVFSLPEEYLVGKEGTSKNVFRAAMRGIVPDPILDRRDKIGFGTPESHWLRTLGPWVEKILSSDAARSITPLRHDVLLRQTRAMLSERQRFDWRVWRWLNLVRWSEQFRCQY